MYCQAVLWQQMTSAWLLASLPCITLVHCQRDDSYLRPSNATHNSRAGVRGGDMLCCEFETANLLIPARRLTSEQGGSRCLCFSVQPLSMCWLCGPGCCEGVLTLALLLIRSLILETAWLLSQSLGRQVVWCARSWDSYTPSS